MTPKSIITIVPPLSHVIRFLNWILLPKIRRNIFEHKKLNTHYYEALKKSIYKPSAFFKGIILSLCDEPDVTLKEATIVASVLSKMSLPVFHSAAALFRLLQSDYSGPRSIFIKTLLDKKYSLPQTIVESLVEYFRKTSSLISESLPVLWHQSFLVFVQRYKKSLSHEQKTVLLSVSSLQRHDQITAEILRELESIN